MPESCNFSNLSCRCDGHEKLHLPGQKMGRACRQWLTCLSHQFMKHRVKSQEGWGSLNGGNKQIKFLRKHLESGLEKNSVPINLPVVG